MNSRISVATIQPPEFINLQSMDVSPLMTKADLKVFYLGQNRNGSAITKATATEMAKTLRGCPIVGQYIDKKDDFGDHGDQIIIDGEGIKFNVLTKPFGFVAPDAKVWFQFFEDTDEFGNTCMREYLMTSCYLWTSQFPEVDRVIKNHNPHSMELDDDTIKGHWATDNQSGIDFFIIDDAMFSKLCILGEDVEPCFEGSMFLEPNMSSNFSKDDDFMKSLFTMMEELKFALKKNSEGGLSMENAQVNTEFAEGQVQETPEQATAPTTENFSSEQDNSNQSSASEINNITEEFAKKENEDEKEKKNSDEGDPASQENNGNGNNKEEDDEEKKKNAKNSLESENVDIQALQNQLSELQNKYSLLEQENKELLAFKQNVENNQKDELIKSFYMLSDEDKADVIANKANYSLDEIESKLSVICVRKKVSFNLEEDNEQDGKEPETATIFNLNSHEADNLPAWLKRVEDIRQSKEN